MAAVQIKYFFIYNPTFGPEEGQEHQKLVYFYPQANTSESERVRVAGLAEALHKFAQSFTNEPLKVMHTKSLLYLLFNPESDYYMVLVLEALTDGKQRSNHPRAGALSGTPDIQNDRPEASPSPSTSASTRNAVPTVAVNSLRPSQSQPALHAIADATDTASNLLSGTKLHGSTLSVQPFQRRTAESDVKQIASPQTPMVQPLYQGFLRNKHCLHSLHAKCEQFFDSYIPSLDALLNSTAGMLLERFNGISYLSLDEAGFLQVNCFVNQFKLTNGQRVGLMHCVFLFQDYLIFSDLESMKDNKLLYSYVTKVMLPAYYDNAVEKFLIRNADLTADNNIVNVVEPLDASSLGIDGKKPRQPHYRKFINVPVLNGVQLSADTKIDVDATTRVYLQTNQCLEESFHLTGQTNYRINGTIHDDDADDNVHNKQSCRSRHTMLAYEEGNCVMLLFLSETDHIGITTTLLDEFDADLSQHLPAISQALTLANDSVVNLPTRPRSAASHTPASLPVSSATSLTRSPLAKFPALMPSTSSSIHLIGSGGGSMEPPYLRFIYLNDVNCAKKQNLVESTPNSSTPFLPAILAFLTDMDVELRRLPQSMLTLHERQSYDTVQPSGGQLMSVHSDIDIIMRPCEDFWLAARRSEQRFIYVIIYSAASLAAFTGGKSFSEAPDLLDVEATVRRLSKLPHVFFV